MCSNYYKDFQSAAKIIGPNGCNIKEIWNKYDDKKSALKIRLRGKNSGFVEKNKKESDDYLHVCIST